ncbi:hypothetical protein GQ457_02G026590 [Hibiscus cannabinus]
MIIFPKVDFYTILNVERAHLFSLIQEKSRHFLSLLSKNTFFFSPPKQASSLEFSRAGDTGLGALNEVVKAPGRAVIFHDVWEFILSLISQSKLERKRNEVLALRGAFLKPCNDLERGIPQAL